MECSDDSDHSDTCGSDDSCSDVTTEDRVTYNISLDSAVDSEDDVIDLDSEGTNSEGEDTASEDGGDVSSR